MRDTLKRGVRKTVKWGGAVLTVLLVVVWIGSAWLFVTRWALPDNYEFLERGVLSVHIQDSAQAYMTNTSLLPDPGWSWVAAQHPGLDWWIAKQNSSFAASFRVPLWLPALLSLLATAAAWRADAKYLRRVREGHCPACGYDRAGLAAGSLCPECGVAPSK